MLNVFDALQGTASTKTRAEVRGGGKKPYAQKGTGNARQGSSRTPLRPGGGVVFGPKVCRAHHPACNILALDNSSASFLMCAPGVFKHWSFLHCASCASQPKDWGIRMNKKERRLALATAFQSATANTVIVEDLKVRSTAAPVACEPAKFCFGRCPVRSCHHRPALPTHCQTTCCKHKMIDMYGNSQQRLACCLVITMHWRQSL